MLTVIYGRGQSLPDTTPFLSSWVLPGQAIRPYSTEKLGSLSTGALQNSARLSRGLKLDDISL